MSDAAFRTRRVQLTAAHYSALSAWAEVNGLDGPDAADAALGVWLNERINNDPNLRWLQAEWRKRRDKTNAELAAEFAARCRKPEADDLLP